MKHIWTIMFALVAPTMTSCNMIPRAAWEPMVTCPTQYFEYGEKQGYFVSVPAYVGFAVGLPLGVATAPAGLVMESHDGMRQYVVLTFACLGPTVVGDVLATPFIVVKSVLWDLPFGAPKANESPVPLDDLLSF